MTPEEVLAHAQVQRHADLESLSELDDEQLDYLARTHEVRDVLTDDIDCDADVDYG